MMHIPCIIRVYLCPSVAANSLRALCAFVVDFCDRPVDPAHPVILSINPHITTLGHQHAGWFAEPAFFARTRD